MLNIRGAWYQAMGLLFPCIPDDLKLARCDLCGWLFSPFNDWRDEICVFDDVTMTMYRICRYHQNLGPTIWDCTRAIEVPALRERVWLELVANEIAYWFRVAVRFLHILATSIIMLLWVRLFHPGVYKAFYGGRK